MINLVHGRQTFLDSMQQLHEQNRDGYGTKVESFTPAFPSSIPRFESAWRQFPHGFRAEPNVLIMQSPEPPPPGVPQLPPFPAPYQPPSPALQPGALPIQQPASPTEPLLSPSLSPTNMEAVPLEEAPVYTTSAALRWYACFLGVVGIPIFGYLLLYGEEDRNYAYQLTAGSSYMAAALVMPFASSVTPLGVVVVSFVSIIVVASVVWRGPLSMKLTSFLIAGSIIIGGILYGLLAGAPIVSLSPGYYGLAAALFTKEHNRILLSIVSWILVASVSGCCFLGWKGVVRKEVLASKKDQRPDRFRWTTLVGCIVCSYPVVAGVSILLHVGGLFALSPIDTVGVYTFPSSLRWTYVPTFVMLALWIGLISLAYLYRINSVTYDELKDAELVGDRTEEQWRLASEGKDLEDLEGSSSSDEELMQVTETS